MAVVLREYEGVKDLDLQYGLWTEGTRDLPWAWKPTRSPTIFASQRNFDARSRRYAFDDGQLVGYMSFTGGPGGLVSPGYPWVLAGYEGDLQEELFETVFGFARGEYGGTYFLLRFRRQWTDQIEFFEGKGFEAERTEPIYAARIRGKQEAKAPEELEIDKHDGFSLARFSAAARRTTRIPPAP